MRFTLKKYFQNGKSQFKSQAFQRNFFQNSNFSSLEVTKNFVLGKFANGHRDGNADACRYQVRENTHEEKKFNFHFFAEM